MVIHAVAAHNQPHSEEEEGRGVSPPFVPLGWQLPLLVPGPGEGPEHSNANACRPDIGAGVLNQSGTGKT